MTFEPVQPSKMIGIGGECIALFPAGGVLWDDFLATINVPLHKFCTEGPSGWMLGYMDALAGQGVRTILILLSAEVKSPARFVDRASRNIIVVLPATATFRWLRRLVPSYRSMLGLAGRPGLRAFLARAIGSIAAYASTPWKALKHELQLHGCRAVLSQEYEFFRFDVLSALARRMGLSVFATFQGSNVEPNLLSRVWKRSLIRKADSLFIAPSREIERVEQTYGSDLKICQIFNPLDLTAWNDDGRKEVRAKAGASKETCIVAWHGRIALRDKGLDILLDAWQQVRLSRPGRDLRLMLLGAGEDSDEFAALLDRTADPSIQWTRHYSTERTQIRLFLAGADIYAFPSRLEGFAVAPLEAMACRLPVVAAKASGITDIFRDELDGGLTVATDDDVAFANALGSLIDDSDKRIRLAYAARRRVETSFSLEHVGRQLADAILGEARS